MRVFINHSFPYFLSMSGNFYPFKGSMSTGIVMPEVLYGGMAERIERKNQKGNHLKFETL